jgi:uncharacterized protein (TIGR02145 family)
MKNEMKIHLSLLTLLIITIMFYGCKKDEPESTPNLYNGKSTAIFNNNLTYGSLTDQDGNIYKTIIIGTQTWMAENLRTTKYTNGESITLMTDNVIWAQLSTGAYCNFENTLKDTTIATYGRLYNWYAVNDNRQIAPEGWHIPTYNDWLILIDFLGNDTLSGGKMKEAGLIHWLNPNKGADNSSGFTALPGSFRGPEVFYSLGETSSFWSSSQYDSSWAFGCVNACDNTFAFCGISEKLCGYSVRCIKD